MAIRKRIALATAALALGSGLAVPPATAATAATSGPWEFSSSRAMTLCLDTHGWSTANSAQIEQGACQGDNIDDWYFEPVSGVSNTYRFSLGANRNKCMNVQSNSTADNAKIILWTCSWATNEQFRVELNPSKHTNNVDWYWIVSVRSGKCLKIAGDSNASGADLVQTYCYDPNDVFTWQAA